MWCRLNCIDLYSSIYPNVPCLICPTATTFHYWNGPIISLLLCRSKWRNLMVCVTVNTTSPITLYLTQYMMAVLLTSKLNVSQIYQSVCLSVCLSMCLCVGKYNISDNVLSYTVYDGWWLTSKLNVSQLYQSVCLSVCLSLCMS